MRTYQQTLDYLFTRLPMYSRVGAAAYKNNLDNTLALSKKLGDPHKQIKTIHIAGTNGKGSTSHMLAAIFQSAGYKTGLYTSPHLLDFRERIKVNGEMVSEDFVVAFTEEMEELMEEIKPSFFEITVVMAMAWFVWQQVDVAIIETGLGGRLDSTNIIIPEISVITNIGMDHMDMLGDTMEKIAAEKAGIIKKGVPVVIGETQQSIKHIFDEKAETFTSPILYADEARWIADVQPDKNVLHVKVAHPDIDERIRYTLDLPGMYQVKNLLTVLETLQVLRKERFSISEEHIKNGLAHVKKLTGLRGRWDIVQTSPKMVLDVGHNVDGIKEILGQLEHEDFHALHIIIGVVKEKDIDTILSILPKTAQYYFTKAQIPRALAPADLEQKARIYSLNGHTFDTIAGALLQAKTNAKARDLILICGSIFLVGEAMETLGLQT
jgi:dihydrofolate synthase / folylpolyglutamate synthase